MTNEDKKVVSLDIGTSHVVAMLGRYDTEHGNKSLEILGYGQVPSDNAIKAGAVVNIKAVANAIKQAIENAAQMSGYVIDSVFASISGNHIQSRNSVGHHHLVGEQRTIKQQDIDKVLNYATSVYVKDDAYLLHSLPQEFVIDLHTKVTDPIDMAARSLLEVNTHLVWCTENAYRNIKSCIEDCGLNLNGLVLSHLVSSEAVLTSDEKELGVCLLDIGGGTCDIAVFEQGTLRYTSVIPIAGSDVTRDIAISFRTSWQEAEQIKLSNGSVLIENTRPTSREYGTASIPNEEKSVNVPRNIDINAATIAEVIQPRYEELFSLVIKDLENSRCVNQLSAGVVLTGGAAKMPGLLELAEDAFHCTVRLGLPTGFVSMQDVLSDPTYSVAVGLLHYGLQQQKKESSKNTTTLDKVRGFFGGSKR